MVQKGKKSSTDNKIKQNIKITCAACGNLKDEKDYYVSYNPIHTTKRIPYCKICLKKMICDDKGNVELEKVKKALQIIDKPFIWDLWRISLEDKGDAFGTYLKNLSLKQNRGLYWKNSQFEPQLNKELNYDNVKNNIVNNVSDFKVTSEIIKRWGNKYEDVEDYIQLENFYNDMKISNNIETAQDIIYLKKLAVISLKMDKALQDGNSSEAKQLGDLFSKYMADSKFRAMDKTDADKTGGIRNFCSIYAEVEKDDFIPPWEYYRKIKGISQDIVDKVIMHIENFTLKLNKIEKMTTPPHDTPKLELDEIDNENTIQINDILVDDTDEDIIEGDEDGIED